MVYSIGYSNKSIEEFIEKLREYGIHTLFDVRAKPYSKWAEQFNRENLRKSLKDAGIDYIHAYPLHGFTDAKDEKYYEWCARVNERAETEDVVVMCCEGDPDKCHRKLKLDGDIQIFQHIRWPKKIKFQKAVEPVEVEEVKPVVQEQLTMF